MSPAQSGFCRCLLYLFWNSRLVGWGQLGGGCRVRFSPALVCCSTSSVLKVGHCICRLKARQRAEAPWRDCTKAILLQACRVAFITRTQYGSFSKPELYKEVKFMSRRNLLSPEILLGLVSTRVSVLPTHPSVLSGECVICFCHVWRYYETPTERVRYVAGERQRASSSWRCSFCMESSRSE